MSFDDQRPRRRRGRSDRQHDQREPDFKDAAFCSPLLRESWEAGAPLNWLEFITGTRMARPESTNEDVPSAAAGG
jgi:hypothetical protein